MISGIQCLSQRSAVLVADGGLVGACPVGPFRAVGEVDRVAGNLGRVGAVGATERVAAAAVAGRVIAHVFDAVRELVRRRVDVRLIVAGDGPMRRQLEQRAAGLPIMWLGFIADRTELANLLRAADLALAPGPVETSGLAALEALACGTPAVVNWRSALPGIVGAHAGRTAAGSGFTFADAVQELLERPEVLLRLAARARAEEFDWDTTVDGFLALHGRALKVAA